MAINSLTRAALQRRSSGAVVEGAEKIVTGLRLMNTETKKRLQAVVRSSLAQIEAGAKSRVPVDTGELRETIRSEMVPNSDDLVGLVKAGYGKLRRRGSGSARSRRRSRSYGKGVYAPVVEFGSKNPRREAKPFLHPSAEQRRPSHMSEARQALQSTISAASDKGGSQ